MSLYEPIRRYLSQAKNSRVALSFGQVERILQRKLPKSAYKHAEWWANNTTGHSHARSWMEAGWRTENVKLAQRTLVFSRVGTPPPADIPDPFGALRGSVVVAPGVDLTAPTGEEWEASRD